MLEQIVTPLLSWYDKHARVLPWREDTAAYRVWVSEIMLQQTRVEAVKPFFERFIKALPDVQALSEAPEDELLKLWEGADCTPAGNWFCHSGRNFKKGAGCTDNGGELVHGKAGTSQGWRSSLER